MSAMGSILPLRLGFFAERERSRSPMVHPTPKERRDYSGGSRRVFKPFAWLGVGSGKVALSRPTSPPARVLRDG